MDDRYGHFSETGNEYIITNPETPRHWFNYLWNDDYITFISQVGYGEGFAQDKMANRAMPVADRNVFLVEGDDFWTANGLPVTKQYDNYSCTHGLGYTEIKQEYKGIASSWRVFVPENAKCEVWTIKITNQRNEKCSLKLIPYIKTAIDGFYRPQGYFVSQGAYNKDLQSLVLKQFVGSFEGKHQVLAYFTSSKEISGYDCQEFAFIGEYGDKLAPEAIVKDGKCRNTDCIGDKLCLALENTINLESGESEEIHFIVGIETSEADICEIRKRIFEQNGVAAEFAKVKEKFSSQIEGVSIKTDDKKFNNLVNYWLKHQANMGSRWARVRHNGYRDLSCDCDCFGSVNPDIAWVRIKRVLSYQYSSGFAPRTWLDGKILDRNYIDNTVWMTFAVNHIVKEIGDLNILKEEVPFNDGTSGSVYEHIKRSVNYLWNYRGENGLIKIWGGDWNDCIERIGPKGKGTTVWLSMAWFRANRMFAELAKLTGNEADYAEAQKRADEMKDIVNKVAWNEEAQYYVRAFTDDGEAVGGPNCEEGKIFINPQIWAVMGGITIDGRDKIAMAAVDKYLDTDLGMLISYPAYSRRHENIGHMSEKHAGVHENGGVYLHAGTWKMVADSIMKRNSKIQEGIEKILPFDDTWEVKKKCEPYILCNSYYGKETGYNYASAGQSWRTGSGAWFLKSVLDYVFGLQPEIDGLRLDPCLPLKWKTCCVTKRFRKATYHITYEQNDPKDGATIREITVNGQNLDGTVLPYEAGKEYQIKVLIG